MKDKVLKISLDYYVENPLDCDDSILLNVIHNPRGYTLRSDEINLNNENLFIFNVYVMDHSLIKLSLYDFCDSWDSWKCGYIAIKKDDFINNKDKAFEYLEKILYEYNCYINGDCYFVDEIEYKYCSCCNQIIDEEVIGTFSFYGYGEMMDYLKENYNLNNYEIIKNF